MKQELSIQAKYFEIWKMFNVINMSVINIYINTNLYLINITIIIILKLLFSVKIRYDNKAIKYKSLF